MDIDAEQLRGGWQRYGPRRSWALMKVLMVVWFVQLAISKVWGLPVADALFKVRPERPADRPWTGITNALGHKDFGHLSQNLVAVIPSGWAAERYLPARRWWGLFLVAGGTGGVAQAWASGNGAIGASAGLAALLAVSLGWGADYVALHTEIPPAGVWKARAVVWLGLGLALVYLYFWGPEGLGHVAHLVGYGFGVAAATYQEYKSTLPPPSSAR